MWILYFVAIVFGFIVGRQVKRITHATFKGPSSSSIKRSFFNDDVGIYQLEPEIFICPSHVSPDDFSHSDDSNSEHESNSE